MCDVVEGENAKQHVGRTAPARARPAASRRYPLPVMVEEMAFDDGCDVLVYVPYAYVRPTREEKDPDFIGLCPRTCSCRACSLSHDDAVSTRCLPPVAGVPKRL